MMKFFNRFDFRVSLVYLLVATIWIIASDTLVIQLVPDDPALMERINLLKGLGYVLVTTITLFLIIRAEVLRQVQIEEELRHEREINPIGIVGLTNTGDIHYANAQAERILGLTRGTIVGQAYNAPIWHITDYEGNPLPDDQLPFTQVMKTHKPIYGVRHAIESDKGRILLEVNAAPLFATDGKIRSVVATIHDVTSTYQNAKALAENEERLRLFIEHAPAASAMFDQEMHYVVASHRWVMDYKLGEQDIIGISHYEVFPEISDEWKSVYRLGLEGKVQKSEEDQFQRLDGSIQWLRWEVRPWYTEERTIGGIVIFTEDITERKRSAERFTENEESFRLLFESNPHPMWVYDLETLAFLEVNHSAVDYYGYSREEFLMMRLPDIRPSEDTERLLEDTQRKRPILQHSGEWRHKLKDGQIIDVEITSHTFEFKGHRAALVVAQDITQRKQARIAEHEQRQLAEALRDSAASLISALDLKMVMDSILENVDRVVPHDAANIMLIENDQVRPAYWRGYHPERTALLQDFRVSITNTPNLHQMFVTGSPFLISDTKQFADWIPNSLTKEVMSYVAAPIRSHGQVIGFLNLNSTQPGFFTEVHAQRLQAFADQASLAIEHAQLYEEVQRHAHKLEQRVAERTAELQQSEARYRAIIEDQTDLVCRYLPGGILTFVNQTYCRHFNRTSEELLGTSLFDLVPDKYRPRIEQHIASLSRENPNAIFEDHQIREDGQEKWFQWRDRILFDETGNFVEYQSVGRDTTESKLAEDQLHQMLEQAMKLNELRSRYMAMAAHDLRNPLAVIQSSISMIQKYNDKLTDEQKQSKYVQIHDTIKLMVAMLDDILMIGQAESGKIEFNPIHLDVVAFCSMIVEESKPATDSKSKIRFSSQGDCSTAYLDPKLLRHILGNLLSNAIKYSPDDTDVTFTIDCNADQISFYIQDQGIGIPKAEQAGLFEAFHRASNARNVRGTGLGLAIVKQSVDLHGGTIMFDSQENMGTTFTIILPHIWTMPFS